MKQLFLILSLLIGLSHNALADNRPTVGKLIGDWYLTLEYQDGSSESTKLFVPHHTNYGRLNGNDLQTEIFEGPVMLRLRRGGSAQLSINRKKVYKAVAMANQQLIAHAELTEMVMIDLKWEYRQGRLLLRVPKGQVEVKTDIDFKRSQGNEGDLSDIEDDEYDIRFRPEVIASFIDNFNKMKLSSFGGNSFTLNGVDTYKATYHATEIGALPGWHVNMIYASHQPRQVGVSNTLSEQQKMMLMKAAQSFAEHFQKTIAPQSGKDATYHLNPSMVINNQSEQEIESTVTLEWLARDILSGVPYGRCQVSGVIKLYPPIRQSDPWRVEFRLSDKNTHADKVSSSSHWEKLREVTILL